ncbi:hypothetical protein AAGV28_07155 [Flavobacterium sp. FZUC8N2.13]|uniref:Uncharacterized protein n=1 Tax=Flavobacterium zubiriense TaxID=3138075 RepID=A0ABV4TDV9_9FLAO
MNTEKQQKEQKGNEVKDTKSLKLLPVAKTAEPTEKSKEAAAVAAIEKFANSAPLTAKERIGRKTLFDEVSKRYEHLERKANDLKMFHAGNDKITAKIILKNQAGFEFEVSNSNVIKKVTDTMEAELNILLTEAENEVLTFEI